jgi:hypothetical protein
MDKLYYWTGYVVWLLAACSVGSWLGLKLYNWRKKHFALHSFGLYMFGLNVIWSAYWQRSDSRHNMLRFSYKHGYNVRRWLGLVLVTRPTRSK